MAHFARLDKNNVVQQVIVVSNQHAPTEEEGINYILNVLKLDGTWLQTSYNGNIRGKFAGTTDIYDPKKDEFVTDVNYQDEIKRLAIETREQNKAELSKKEAIAAKIGLTVEELQTILKG